MCVLHKRMFTIGASFGGGRSMHLPDSRFLSDQTGQPVATYNRAGFSIIIILLTILEYTI